MPPPEKTRGLAQKRSKRGDRPTRPSDHLCRGLKHGWRRRRGDDRYCTKTAGWGTDHVGQGRCRLHGGVHPMPAGGIYSEYARERLGPALKAMGENPDPLNLLPELELLRAIVAQVLAENDPERLPERVALITDKITRLTKTIHEMKTGGLITMATLSRVTEQMGVIVSKHVADPAVLAAIERDWSALVLG